MNATGKEFNVFYLKKIKKTNQNAYLGPFRISIFEIYKATKRLSNNLNLVKLIDPYRSS